MEIKELKEKIKNNKISYQEIANNTNISISTIKDIFRGKTKNPRLDTLKLICNYLNENPNNLFENTKIEPYITTDEQEILNAIRQMSEPQKRYLKVYINTLLDKEILIDSKRSVK